MLSIDPNYSLLSMSYQHSFELLDDFVVWHGQDGVGGVVVDLGEVTDRRGTLHGAAVPTAVTAGLAATSQAPNHLVQLKTKTTIVYHLS